jgi:serine/threonine protein kinase
MTPPKPYSNSELVSTFYKLAKFHDAMKQLSIIHRDVKLDNIFLSSKGEPKVGDFGTAIDGLSEGTDFSIKGTEPYFSPAKREAMDSGEIRVNEDPEKGDVWSLGICFLECVMMQRPERINYKNS